MTKNAERDIQLITTDVDGTLLTAEKALAPEGAQLLKAAAKAGIHVVLATTRNPDAVLPHCRTLELTEPIICSNGAQVWGSPDGPVWSHYPIPHEAALKIAHLADEQGWELSTTVGSMTYWRQRPGQALRPIDPHITVVASNTDALVGKPVRILTWQPEAIDGIRELCERELADRCYAVPFYNPDGTTHSLGIFALEANKGRALEVVLDRLDIQPAQAMALGDNLNDLPMFDRAGVSVAMANAPDAVKQAANTIAPSNEDEGVAWALKAYNIV